MNAPVKTSSISRRARPQGRRAHRRLRARRSDATALAQGAAGAPRVLDPKEVDAFLAVNGDGTVTVFCGKVDLGQGLRIAIPQIAAEELGIGVDKIKYVEGDTALTPDQGRTSGSNGIQRGGMQIRQAAATARKALIELAAQRLNAEARRSHRRRRRGAAEGRRRRHPFRQLDRRPPVRPQARSQSAAQGSRELHASSANRCRGPTCRPNASAQHIYMHDFTVPGMLHARVIRPPAIGATLVSVDEGSIKDLPGVKVVRIKDFLAVVAEDEWTAVRAARALRAQWSEGSGLPAQDKLAESLRDRSRHYRRDPGQQGDGRSRRGRKAPRRLTATYFWPMQSHASIGPSCAVADVRADAGDGVDRLAGHARQSQHLCPLPRPAAREGAADLSRRLRLLRHERPRGRGRRRRDPVARGRATRCACNGRARTSTAGIRRARRNCSTSRERSTPTAASSTGAPRCGFRRPPRVCSIFRCWRRRQPGSTMSSDSIPA